jgi:hypothetical protein
LSRQLVVETNKLVKDVFDDLKFARRVNLGPAARAVPFLQKAATSGLECAAAKMGFNVTVNSALRTLAQQLILYKWFQQHKCGITAAATPGTSNHESGLAVDIANPDAWQSRMEACGWHRLGSFDPPHYDYKAGGVDIRRTSVKAFQILWNKHHPNEKIDEDGLYGPKTESAILRVRTSSYLHISRDCDRYL